MAEAFPVLMPRLSDSMAEGTIVRWLKHDGERVLRGESIVEIDTDKTTMVFEAEHDGTIRLLGGEGETFEVGMPIASIEASATGQAASLSMATGADLDQTEATEDDKRPEGAASSTAAPRNDTPNVSPVARRLALELGVDLAVVVGTGSGGRVLREDVAAAAGSVSGRRPTKSSAAAVGPAATAEPSFNENRRALTRRERIVGQRMTQAGSVPTFYVEIDIVMTQALRLREQLSTIVVPVPSLNDIVVKAAALVLREHPRLNASLDGDEMLHHDKIDISLAIAVGVDLFVPTIESVDELSLAALAARSRDLVERSRAGTLTLADLKPGTFTVSNLGMFGVTRFTPLLNPPQAAILSVGALHPGSANLGEAQETILTVGMVCDHRIVYGAHAAAFLQSLRALLEEPIPLMS